MQDTHHQRLYFGDLHFHTHYSDNRDRASIEEMILAGTRYHLSIFGTADHNHNLDAEKWRQTREETDHLREKYSDLLLLNNCEITFLLGHLNVLIPEHIEGTIAEGYRYLYLDKQALKIINHPIPTTDEWHTRLIPDAIGVEVINGAVFTHGKKRGYRIHSAIDIPSVNTYATYLSSGIPVAAIGASDAHQKVQMGHGMTGFRLADKPDSQSVIDAILEHQTFATTDCEIVLTWSPDAAKHAIAWHVDWNKENSSYNTVEIYCGDQRIATTTDADGTLSVEHAGLYWIAVFDEDDIAISSPIAAFLELTPRPPLFPREGEKTGIPTELLLPLSSQERGPGGEFSQKSASPDVRKDYDHILNIALQNIRQDLTWLSMGEHQRSQPTLNAFSQDVDIEIITSVELPKIHDAHGENVEYEVIDRGSPRVIIDKECDIRGFDEFYIWLTRNELHEYVFVDIEYDKVGQTFFFNGRLLPRKMVHCEQIETRYRDDMEEIWGLLDEQTRCKLYVSTLPSLLINIHLDSKDIPYRICDDLMGLDSLLFYVDEDIECPVHILEHVNGIQYGGKKPLQERIYQMFACVE